MTDTTWSTLASGIGFTEGPLWMPDGTLLVTSMSRGLIYRLALERSEPIASYETGGGPNGLALRGDGSVVIAQNGSATFASRSERPARPGIQLLIDGEVHDLLDRNSAAPNDLFVAADGRVWFTDPGSPVVPDFRPCVRRLDVATGELQTLTAEVRFPNGLAMGPDGRFYLADSETSEILRFTVTVDGLSDREVFAVVPNAGGPDGIAFDAAGSLYVASFDTNTIDVFDRNGTLLRSMPTGEGSRPTNLCFAGPDLSRLVVTLASGGRVIVADERFEGAAL